MEVDRRFLQLIRWLARLAALVSILSGGVVLWGWNVDDVSLKSFMHSGKVATHPLVAVEFILAGVALLLLRAEPLSRWRQRMGTALGAAVF